MIDRAFLIHTARVYLNEFRARRGSHINRDFKWTMFEWAQRARREAQRLRPAVQGDLFEGLA